MNSGGRDATLVGMISQAKANALSSGSTTSNVPEGTNLYFTATRARSVISAEVVFTAIWFMGVTYGAVDCDQKGKCLWSLLLEGRGSERASI